MIWKEFKALGTDIVIMADLKAEQENILLEAEQEILNFEKRFSRFLADSELSKFNNYSNNNQEASASMIELLTLAKYYYSKTKGIFDPTIISSLEAIGYNQSFAEMKSSTAEINIKELQENFLTRSKFEDLKIVGKKVSCPANFKIDLGGIGKGYIVDLISQKFFSNLENYWISAGGDILISGQQDSASNWKVEVQNPLQPEQNSFVIDTQGKKVGIATSGIIKRGGLSGNFAWHHLIDPQTGLPVINDILSVTVISSSAVKADVLAKTVLIMGEVAGLNFLESEIDSAGIIFTKNNEPIISERAHLYLKNI